MSKIRVAIAGVGKLCKFSACRAWSTTGTIPARTLPGSCIPGSAVGESGISRSSPPSTSTAARSASRSSRRSSPSPTAPGCFRTCSRSSSVIVEMGRCSTAWRNMAELSRRSRPSAWPTPSPCRSSSGCARPARRFLICYLPVGSEQAARHYAEACLAARVGLVNCMPVFIASDPAWAARFREAGVPIIGDDIKSQLGATITHRALTRLFGDRGVKIDRTYQLNVGGNTDFLNMLERSRLRSKKTSKHGSVRVSARPTPRRRRHPHRPVRLHPVAPRPQGRVHPYGRPRLRRHADGIELRLSVEDFAEQCRGRD